jgi:hypothetical protein
MASTATTPIWNGTGGAISGSTPFGFYDLDPAFQSDGPKVANFCARKLGYPIMEVELQSGSFYACFEEAVSVYSEELYLHKIKDNYLTLEGSSTASLLNNEVVIPNLNYTITVAENYGTPIQVGGYVNQYKAPLYLTSSQQTYDLEAWALSGSLIQPGDRVVVNRIYYEAQPAINQYYDPYIGGSINYQGATENFGWASYSPGLNFVLFPIYWDISRIQEIEMSNIVRRSMYSFQITNNKLTIFPWPDTDGIVVWIDYAKFSELSSVQGNSPYSGSKGLVTNPSNVPYANITYSQINQPGKQWIYEYTLALASELLGLIRGKYTQVPVPGAEVTLNGADLISKGRDQQTALRERLRSDFDQLSRQSQLERKQSENQSISSTLNEVPMFIYIGSYLIFIINTLL